MPRFMRFLRFLHASGMLYVLRIACFGRRPIRRTHSLRSISGLVELDVLRHNCVPNCCRTLISAHHVRICSTRILCGAHISLWTSRISSSNFTVQGTITVTVPAPSVLFVAYLRLLDAPPLTTAPRCLPAVWLQPTWEDFIFLRGILQTLHPR
ncbi:hypothetical protein DFH06DRAFT_1147927 [Mycena polygramma]|nr:hypothetical protein DFH06DRAFT_1147927 [Mycena polygramma]